MVEDVSKKVDETEASIRSLHDSGNMHGAATAALERYGDEVLGFVLASVRAESDAAEVFSDLCEDMWRGLPKFAWRSSMRTWLYVLARHATARYMRAPSRRPERNESTAELGGLIDRVRSRTQMHLRTEVKDAVAEIRRSLPEDDQTLLILRVDRRMAWNDIALVMAGPDLEAADLKRESAKLRKRFQGVKDELRERAREAGLM